MPISPSHTLLSVLVPLKRLRHLLTLLPFCLPKCSSYLDAYSVGKSTGLQLPPTPSRRLQVRAFLQNYGEGCYNDSTSGQGCTLGSFSKDTYLGTKMRPLPQFRLYLTAEFKYAASTKYHSVRFTPPSAFVVSYTQQKLS